MRSFTVSTSISRQSGDGFAANALRPLARFESSQAEACGSKTVKPGSPGRRGKPNDDVGKVKAPLIDKAE
jgi:hypothetical protein